MGGLKGGASGRVHGRIWWLEGIRFAVWLPPNSRHLEGLEGWELIWTHIGIKRSFSFEPLEGRKKMWEFLMRPMEHKFGREMEGLEANSETKFVQRWCSCYHMAPNIVFCGRIGSHGHDLGEILSNNTWPFCLLSAWVDRGLISPFPHTLLSSLPSFIIIDVTSTPPSYPLASSFTKFMNFMKSRKEERTLLGRVKVMVIGGDWICGVVATWLMKWKDENLFGHRSETNEFGVICVRWYHPHHHYFQSSLISLFLFESLPALSQLPPPPMLPHIHYFISLDLNGRESGRSWCLEQIGFVVWLPLHSSNLERLEGWELIWTQPETLPTNLSRFGGDVCWMWLYCGNPLSRDCVAQLLFPIPTILSTTTPFACLPSLQSFFIIIFDVIIYFFERKRILL